MIRLFAVNILPLQDEACFQNCYLRSSKGRREQADTLKMPGDKARCIAAGLLLEYAYEKFRIEKTKELADANSFGYVQEGEEARTSEKLRGEELLPKKLPEIRVGLRGKPEFVFPEGEEPESYFNLSHSGDYVICAMADFEVGADIQRRTRVRESLLRRFFSEEEKAEMQMCGEDETLRERTFARIWAPKEAETKLTGRGIGQLLEKSVKSFRVEEIASAGGEKQDDKLHIWQGMIDEDHAWAVASYPEATSGEPEVLAPVMVDEGELFYE